MMLKIKKQIETILMLGFGLSIIYWGQSFEWDYDQDIKIYVSIWVVLIIGFIIYNVWFKTSKDYINNEEEKISFLNEEFDYLINSVIEFEGLGRSFGIKRGEKKKIKYTVTEIIINRPRKIKKMDGKF